MLNFTAALLEPFDRDVLLSTGRAVRIRPARSSDVDSLRRFYGELTDDSRRLRFFSLRMHIPDEELCRATSNDVHEHVALVAESEGVLIGVGEYYATAAGDEAEVAFAVADAHQHEGIATVLLDDLALIARAAGFRRLVAQVLPCNVAMRAVFRAAGLAHRSWLGGDVVHVELDLDADHLAQVDDVERGWIAA